MTTKTEDPLDELREKLLAIEFFQMRLFESSIHNSKYAMLHPNGIDELVKLIQSYIQQEVVKGKMKELQNLMLVEFDPNRTPAQVLMFANQRLAQLQAQVGEKE